MFSRFGAGFFCQFVNTTFSNIEIFEDVKAETKEPVRKRRRKNARERAALKKEEEEEMDVFEFPLSPVVKDRESDTTAKLKKAHNPRKRKRVNSDPARLKRKKPNEPSKELWYQ